MPKSGAKLPESIEMYLETILLLSKQNEHLRQVDVARAMGFARPSVHATVNKLQAMGLLEDEPSGHIRLTPAGKARAQAVYERHRLFARFLVAIGVDEQTAQADACKIEHDVSQQTFDCIRRFCEENFDDPKA